MEAPEPIGDRGGVRVAAVIAVALAGAFVIWLLFKGDGNDANKAAAPKRAPASAVSLSDLRDLQRSVGHPVYWAGPKSGYNYELSRTADGNIYLRYLPSGIEPGVAAADYLSVSTYPNDDAFGTVEQASKRENERVDQISGGGLAVSNPDLPGSVYVARPGSKYLIEVYDPSPARARKIATSGQVVPIN
jgi:hypothetical protein